MSIIEIIRTKPNATFKTIVRRDAISHFEYDGYDARFAIRLIGGGNIDLSFAREEDAAKAYDDLRIALQQPIGIPAVINISLV